MWIGLDYYDEHTVEFGGTRPSPRMYEVFAHFYTPHWGFDCFKLLVF